jgi:hypothetical protein
MKDNTARHLDIREILCIEKLARRGCEAYYEALVGGASINRLLTKAMATAW